MQIINFGSLNIDRVYQVDHFVQAGETMSSCEYQNFCGGKGLNQSLAAARAGATVIHAGAVGPDGALLEDCLKESDVDVSQLAHLPIDTGHAIIQVVPSGQNCIIVTGGANVALTQEYVDRVMEQGREGDVVLLQNEVNQISYIITQAKKRGLRVALNPSPITQELLAAPLDQVDWLILNEIEGARIAGCEKSYSEILQTICEKYPNAAVVLTLGCEGVLYRDQKESGKERCFPVKAIDTTAAGDTFCGYFLAGCIEGLGVQQCLTLASRAAAIAVTRAGASASIPVRAEVETYSFAEDGET